MARTTASSPERTALARAIEAAQAVRKKRDAALATEAPAQRAVRAAEEAVEDATERLHRAKASAASSASNSMLAGDVLELPASLRTARATLVDAEDRLDVARAARDQLNTQRSDTDGELTVAQAAVVAARDAVVQAEGAARAKVLASELVECQRRTAAVADELRWLLRAGAVPLSEEPGYTYGKPSSEDLRDALFRLDPRNIPLPGKALMDMVPSPSPSSVWAASSAALETDASAPLPGIGR